MKAGDKIKVPQLIEHNQYEYECPICSKYWATSGSKTGFVKAGAKRHVSPCFRRKVESIGLRISHKKVGETYDMLLIITNEEFKQEQQKALKFY